MGWLPIWGQEDPLKDIDPSLRQFLEKETPKQYKAEHELQQQRASSGWTVPTFRSIFGFGEGSSDVTSADQRSPTRRQEPQLKAEDQRLPQESLFQDGRYAHLWKTYRPTAETEQAAKSDQEKLEDIVGAFKERHAELGRAAMENCANEQMALHECFSSGSWAARMTMCRAQNKELEKCIGLQTRFLRALGYLSLYDRPRGESEKIQMHADKLYQKMLEQENELDNAKNKGLPTPDFDPLIKTKEGQPNGLIESQASSSVRGMQHEMTDEDYQPHRLPIRFESLPQHLQEKYREEHLKGLEGPERTLAKQELEQDLAWKAELLDRFSSRYMEEHKERQERAAKGQERFGDKIKRWFDMRDYSQAEEIEGRDKEHKSALWGGTSDK